jgi:hypothetical protein
MKLKAEKEAKLKEFQEKTGQTEFEDEEEGGEWVTMENLYTHISHGDAGALNLIAQDPLPEVNDPSQIQTDGSV